MITNAVWEIALAAIALIIHAVIVVWGVCSDRKAGCLCQSSSMAFLGTPSLSEQEEQSTKSPPSQLDNEKSTALTRQCCAAPLLCADIQAVSAWLRSTAPGAKLDIARQPKRIINARVTPFVMVSYHQRMCNSNWALMAAELDILAAHGWSLVWMDVAVINTEESDYVQAQFEAAMRWAVDTADAIVCPTPAADSLHYLDRPWCYFEASTALRRKKLWCRNPTAFTEEGRRSERLRRLKWAVGCVTCSSSLHLGLIAFIVFGWDPADYCPGGELFKVPGCDSRTVIPSGLLLVLCVFVFLPISVFSILEWSNVNWIAPMLSGTELISQRQGLQASGASSAFVGL